MAMVMLCFFGLNLLGQELHLNTPPVLEKHPFFNTEFIQRKSVKSIQTQVLYKVPNKKIRETTESVNYTFDKEGRVSKLVSVNSLAVKDSVSFVYNKQGQLIKEYQISCTRNEEKSFTYNPEGLLLKLELMDSETNELINKEEFKYESFVDNQYKRYYLNDENLTYKSEVVDLDDLGRITESRIRYIRGMNKEYTTYTYDADRLVIYSYNKKEITRREERYEMTYDENSVLQITKKFIDGALVHRYEYLYEEGIMIAILRKNMKNQEIQITKMKYSFY